MEFNESSKTKMMSEVERSHFFDFCVQKIEEEYYSGNFEIIFISEDDEILKRLLFKKISFILILPNIFKKRVMQEYKGVLYIVLVKVGGIMLLSQKLAIFKTELNFTKIMSWLRFI